MTYYSRHYCESRRLVLCSQVSAVVLQRPYNFSLMLLLTYVLLSARFLAGTIKKEYKRINVVELHCDLEINDFNRSVCVYALRIIIWDIRRVPCSVRGITALNLGVFCFPYASYFFHYTLDLVVLVFRCATYYRVGGISIGRIIIAIIDIMHS